MVDLDFKGKQAVYAHHLTVPIRPLVPDRSKSLNPRENDNLIIHGDNLHALKALLPHYAGRINCIYIDPPYNTGNECWVYNDNVNSPMIQKWLKSKVDYEDLERHAKWLCMMWPRLQLLKELLAEDSAIFVSIDDNEGHRLRLLMDEIFSCSNFIAQLVWKKKYTGGKHSGHFVDLHEYVLVYGNKQEIDKFVIERPESETKKFIRKDENFSQLGCYYERPFKSNLSERRTLVYPITLPDGNTITTQWLTSKAKFEKWQKIGKAYFKKLQRSGKYAVYVKYYEREGNGKVMFPTIIDDTSDVMLDSLRKKYSKEIRQIMTEQQGKNATNAHIDMFLKTMFINPSVIEGVYNNDATTELKHIFEMKETRETKSLFSTSKPSVLIKRLLRTATDKDAIILDSFAGSGTTAQSILALNKEDGGNRKFILVECENYANTITAERVRRVINGIPTAGSEYLREALGGSFTYCTLGKPLDINAMLTGEVLPDYSELASHLLYTATGTSVNKKLKQKNKDGLFHSVDDTDYYLLYKPDLPYLLSDKAMLNDKRARRISDTSKKAVVFGPGKHLGQRELTRMGITFCFILDSIRQA